MNHDQSDAYAARVPRHTPPAAAVPTPIRSAPARGHHRNSPLFSYFQTSSDSSQQLSSQPAQAQRHVDQYHITQGEKKRSTDSHPPPLASQSHTSSNSDSDSTPLTQRIREQSTKWANKMLKIFEPLDFTDAKPKRPQHTYVVQPGDTIPGIALRHGMKEAEVRALNNLWDGNVFTGQEIKIHRKKRSQSMPELAVEFADSQHNKQSEQRRQAEPTNQAEDEPVAEEDHPAVSPTKSSRRSSTLGVILEQQPQSLSSLGDFFISLFSSSSTVDDMREANKKETHAPRLKTRSYSERLPTNQEEENDIYALPKLIGAKETEILSETRLGPKLVPKIEAFLPMRLRGYDWKLLYSLAQHGSSLHSLMRKARGERSTLVVVETCDGEVFGGFAAAAWEKSLSYYGSGESFVFTNEPTFEVFNWKRTNSMFMFSTEESIAMGGGGEFAWFMNSDLSRGTSGMSETFGNRPLTSHHSFEIANCEVWGFQMF